MGSVQLDRVSLFALILDRDRVTGDHFLKGTGILNRNVIDIVADISSLMLEQNFIKSARYLLEGERRVIADTEKRLN